MEMASSRLQLLNVTLSRTVRVIHSTLAQTQRAFHTSQPVMLTKILSVDEIFNKKSLQAHLRKKELEYNSWLESISSEPLREDEEDLNMKKKTDLSALRPLVQKIRELQEKQKELEDTQDLLKGSTLEIKSFLESHFIYICISFQTMSLNYKNWQNQRRMNV